MSRSEARGVVLAVVAVLVFASAAAGWLFISVPQAAEGGVEVAQLPPRTGISPVTITLYGKSDRGWGYSNATITKPGPNVTVYYGDDIVLTLISNDSVGVVHNWFLDYNNDSIPNGDEPKSPDFNIAGSVAIVFRFSPNHPGNWTYRCFYHSRDMFGRMRVLPEPRPVNLTLHGDAVRGWGFSNATIRNPGPPLVVLWGTTVTLILLADYRNDTAPHNWFIDYDNSRDPSGQEPRSPDFNVPPGKVISWAFTADRTGNWTYRCRFHPTTMTGNISIVGGPPPEPLRGALPLITEIMLGTLGFVLVFAAVYHYRAVRAAKRIR